MKSSSFWAFEMTAQQNRKLKVYFFVVFILPPLLVLAWITYTRQMSRLNLGDIGSDDYYTAEKSIGIVPASGKIFAEGVGFVDQTIFYRAHVRPYEVKWLDLVPEVSSLEVPMSSPLWWRFDLWWCGFSSDIRYFRTKAKWPCIFAYSKEKGVLFGTAEFE